jgi:signal transduction histidine kinase
MTWLQRLESRSASQASQTTQFVWLAFAVLALSLALPGIPRYIDLLRTPCDGADCFGAQLTSEIAQAQRVTWGNLESYALVQFFVLLMMAGLLLSTAGFLIWRKVHQRVSVLAAFVATALATSTLSQALAYTDPRFWLPSQFIVFVQMAGLLPLFCLFPDGQFQPRPMRWVALTYALTNVIYLIPHHREWLAPGTPGGALWLIFGLLSLMVVVTTLFYRFRHAAIFVQQEQMLWVLAGLGQAALVVLWSAPLRLLNFSFAPFEVLLRNPSGATVTIGLFLALGSFTCLLVALFNAEPLDTQLLVNRALVYSALTAFVIGGYGLIVGYLSTVFHSDYFIFSLIATGFVAIAFNPLRDRLQRAVNRLMYGDRDDPYAVLSRFGQRLETTLAANSILPTIVETITQTLKLPYAAIRLLNETIIAHGVLPPNIQLESFPLMYQGEPIGQLEIAPRAADEAFTPAERRLLTDIAHQAGVAAHAVRLTADLQHARERLVTTREEERRRLRRDLHDGLGPKLAGQALILEAVRDALEPDSQSRSLVDHLITDSQTVVSEIRGLVQGLRPPALDEFGLVGALRSLAAQCESGPLRVTVTAPNPMPPLPAAVEVAAYRIAQEALTNVVKHAQATDCQVRLAFGDATLRLDVRDNGLGLSATRRPGVGLSSMRERAEEIGGHCVVEAGIDGGTAVTAQLPITNNQ